MLISGSDGGGGQDAIRDSNGQLILLVVFIPFCLYIPFSALYHGSVEKTLCFLIPHNEGDQLRSTRAPASIQLHGPQNWPVGKYYKNRFAGRTKSK